MVSSRLTPGANMSLTLQAATFKNIKSLQPLFDRVLVQRFKPETVSANISEENRVLEA